MLITILPSSAPDKTSIPIVADTAYQNDRFTRAYKYFLLWCPTPVITERKIPGAAESEALKNSLD
jgi:hypothetical protein